MDNAKLYKSQKMKYFLVIDQGTSSTRAILFNEKFAVVNVSQTEFKQFFPKDGWVEHDANEIWSTQIKSIKDVLEKSGYKCNKFNSITSRPEVNESFNYPTIEPKYDANKLETQGSAFAILNDGYFVTNDHVSKNCANIHIGKNKQKYPY